MELEVRLKNDGDLPVNIDENLNPEGGNVSFYVARPDGIITVIA